MSVGKGAWLALSFAAIVAATPAGAFTAGGWQGQPSTDQNGKTTGGTYEDAP